jgi:hypothetical protein
MTPDDLVGLYESAPDPPWLQGLSAVDWSAVGHAHGPATDVPALLRAAVSDAPEHREFAFELLAETIWHQGAVYPATAQVVPFLYRLLEADETPDKQEVALLLTTIAGCQLATITDGQTGADEDLAATRRAVAGRLDLLYPYLRDPEWGVRHAVAWTISRFPEIAVRLLPDLEDAYRKEPNKAVRLALAWAIGQSPEAAVRLLPELEAAFPDEPDRWYRQALREVIGRLTHRRT